MGRAFGGGDPFESLALARLACAVGEDAPHADVCAACWSCSTSSASTSRRRRPGRPFPLAGRFLIAALTVARTPDVPLPANLPAAADARRGGRRLHVLALAAAGHRPARAGCVSGAGGEQRWKLCAA